MILALVGVVRSINTAVGDKYVAKHIVQMDIINTLFVIESIMKT